MLRIGFSEEPYHKKVGELWFQMSLITLGILAVSLMLWVLTNFPMVNGHAPDIQDSVVAKVGHFIEPAIRPMGYLIIHRAPGSPERG